MMDERRRRQRHVKVLARTAIFALALLPPSPLASAAPASRAPAKGASPSTDALAQEIDRRAAAINDRVVAWRRDIHQNPELSNHETRTAALVAEHLRKLGIEVKTGIARTGVVGLLKGKHPGPVVALRADMDALPVTERTGLPFASKARGVYNGEEVGVMHACGHDAHVAILMGVAEVLASVRDKLPGTVKLIFQPAEESSPVGEVGGAELMVQEGVLEDPRPKAIFGLHVMSDAAVGTIHTRSGGMMAASDRLEIRVRGRQTHAARPWSGVDPVVAASQIVLALQTIMSRQVNITRAPAIVTVATIHGGVRHNIIPDEVVMTGTIRTLEDDMRADVHERVKRTAETVAGSAGATAEVIIDHGYPVTSNDAALTQRMEPTLRRLAGEGNLDMKMAPILGSEDFSYYQKAVPGLFIILGVRTRGVSPDQFPSNHSPLFMIDEAVLPLGVRALAHLAADSLRMKD